jgi:nitrite reductase (NADH) large subunit
MKKKLVLVGNGMAGMRTLEELLKLAPDQYDITVFGAEPYGNYNRILLSPVLAGEKTVQDIMLNDDAWYTRRGITFCKGLKIASIDRQRRRVCSEGGEEACYDRLVLATGSQSRFLPVPGLGLEGVVGFRDVGDVEYMLRISQGYRNAVVIGGGLLGLEAANGLTKRGMSVTVVHHSAYLMNRQLDKPAADLLKRAMEDIGIKFRLKAETKALLGETRVRSVRLGDGEELAADLVVMAVGIQPNISLAQNANIYCEQGIVVDDTLQTFDPRIYAVGECVQHRKQLFGLVAPVFEQAKVCANHLAEFGIARYEGSATSTKLKVTGIDLFSAGQFQSHEGCEELIYEDTAQGVYKKLVIRENRIQGTVLYGDILDGAWYFRLMREATDISSLRGHILFGQ